VQRIVDHTADQALAAACARGEPAALTAFDRDHRGGVMAALRRLRLAPVQRDEVRQRLYEQLFVAAPGRPPKIADYAGRGSLASWLRVVAVRTALSMLRNRDRVATNDAVLAMLVAPGDPELELMKHAYGAEFRAALRDAADELAPRERNVLSYVFVDKLGPAEIGALLDVHRTTALRWIEAAQRRLIEGARRALVHRLGIAPSEVDSVLRLIHSQLERGLGLSSLLR
jgi:RNA polymerase sigma-70 factor (ECF subfamily)